MSGKKSNRRRNAALVSLVTVLVCLVVIVVSVVMVVKIWVNTDGSSSPAPSSDEASSLPTSSEQASSEQESSLPAESSRPTSSAEPVTGNKICYLTFDDGPSDNTPKILDVLDRYNVKATFFVVGNAGRAYPKYLTEIVNRGHAIALHSYTHEYDQIYVSEEAFFSDLNKLDELVYNWTGVHTKLMRFPGGSSNAVSKKYCAGIMTRLTQSIVEKGYHYFDWNAMCGDAEYVPGHYPHSVEELMEYIKESSTSSSVCVLMHDTNDKATTVDALPQIIEYYQSYGYEFAALDETVSGFKHRVNN